MPPEEKRAAARAELDRLWARGTAFLGCEFALLGGAKATVDFSQVLVRRLTVTGGFRYEWLNSQVEAASAPATASAAPGAAKGGDASDAGNVEQYRLALMSAARKFKKYPAQAMEKGWTGKVENGGFVFAREVRGVRQASILDAGLLGSAEARRLDEQAPSLRDAYATPALLIRKTDETRVAGPSALVEAVMAAGQKGISQMQRYKGLGEMNAEQLWETTLDRNVRTLLQVKIKELDEADDIFAKLMGDMVEPRREFIQDNALSVANLDV